MNLTKYEGRFCVELALVGNWGGLCVTTFFASPNLEGNLAILYFDLLSFSLSDLRGICFVFIILFQLEIPTTKENCECVEKWLSLASRGFNTHFCAEALYLPGIAISLLVHGSPWLLKYLIEIKCRGAYNQWRQDWGA